MKKLFFSSLIVLLLIGCQSYSSFSSNKIKNYSKTKSSLLVLYWESENEVDLELTLFKDINSTIDIKGSGSGIVSIRLKPGEYILSNEYGNFSIILSENSITLLPEYINISNNNNISFLKADEDIRYKAGIELTNSVGFIQWSDRKLLGFGLCSPASDISRNESRINMDSNIDSAKLYINNQFVGLTPINFNIPNGRHTFLLRSEGYRDIQQTLEIDFDQDIFWSLNPESSTDQFLSDRKDFSVAIAGFKNIGEIDNFGIGNVVEDTIKSNLETFDRVLVVDNTTDWIEVGTTLWPDFSTLQYDGIDLLVTCDYFIENNEININAMLHEVNSEVLVAQITYKSPINVDIFSMADEVADLFIEKVDVVIPDTGKVLATDYQSVTPSLSSADIDLLKEDIIHTREKSPNIISATVGFGSIMGNNSTEYLTAVNMIIVPLTFTYDYQLTPYFSIGGGISTSLTDYFSNSVEINLFINPKLLVEGYKFDLYLGLPIGFRFHSGALYGSHGEANTFTFTTMIQPGVRLYLSHNKNSMPVFFDLNFGTLLFGYGVVLDNSSTDGMLSFKMKLAAGFGVRF